MVITATQYVGPHATGAYFCHSKPPILDFETGKPTGDVAQLFVLTLNVFHVCFQVAFYRSPDPRFARDGSTLIGIDADPPDVLVPLWPVGPTQKWPAGYSIGQNTLLDFCRRWNP